MSMSNVLGYARTRMKALGFVEHPDANNFENISRNNLDTAFHLELGTFTRDGENQNNMEILAPFTVKFFRGIRRDTNTTRDEVIVKVDTIIDAFIKASNRLTISGINTVVFDSGIVEELSDNNDNAFMITLEFTALVIKSTT